MQRDIYSVRLWNLRLLIKQAIADNAGRERGAVAHIARLTGVRAPLLSMILRGHSNARDGSPRTIGDETARRLERGMGRPVGWMDRDHALADTVELADHLDNLRMLSADQRAAVVALAAQMAALATKSSAPVAQTPESTGPAATT